MLKFFRYSIALFGLTLFFSSSAKAEILTWVCSFNERLDKSGMAEEQMELTFRVDSITQKAYMEGNIGVVDVRLFIGDDAFSFTERLLSGAIQATTITRDGYAVHSRHTILLGEVLPAQHFGYCTPD